MLPCDLSTEEVFTELRRPPAPVDILIASLVFDVVCVDTDQLEVGAQELVRKVYNRFEGNDETGFKMAEA